MAILNTRLRLKYDTWANWTKDNFDKTFVPLRGEVCVVEIPAEATSTEEVTQKPSILFKVGDGDTTFAELDWASGLAADVYSWAKKEYAEASDITVKDTANNFVGTDVETVLAEIWGELKALTGDEEGVGSVAAQIAAGIEKLGSDSAATGYYVSGVKVVDGKLEVEETILPDYTNVYAAKSLEGTVSTLSGKVDQHIANVAEYDARITEADRKGAQGIADAATAKGAADTANANANTRLLQSEFATFKTTNTAAIEAAEKAGTDAAAVVDGKLTEYKTSNAAALAGVKATADAAAVKANVDAAFEGVNATIATLATKADVEASFETVNGEIDEINEAIEAINTGAATHAKQADLEAEIDRATKAEAQTLADAKAYTDNMKNAILGEGIKDTFDTLKEIQDWIETDGVNATELTTAIATETKAREEADEDFETRVSALEGKVDVEKVSTAISTGVAGEAALREAADTALSNRIKAYEDVKDTYALKTEVEAAEGRAATDATNKANTAEVNAKAYTDTTVAGLDSSVAAAAADSGKVSVLTGVTQENGVLSGHTEVKLAKVASTGSIYDVIETEKDLTGTEEVDCLILFGGSASELIKNYN